MGSNINLKRYPTRSAKKRSKMLEKAVRKWEATEYLGERQNLDADLNKKEILADQGATIGYAIIQEINEGQDSGSESSISTMTRHYEENSILRKTRLKTKAPSSIPESDASDQEEDIERTAALNDTSYVNLFAGMGYAFDEGLMEINRMEIDKDERDKRDENFDEEVATIEKAAQRGPMPRNMAPPPLPVPRAARLGTQPAAGTVRIVPGARTTTTDKREESGKPTPLTRPLPPPSQGR